MPPPGYDVRTTPRVLQIPAFLFLVCMAVYLEACLHLAMRDGLPSWAWMGTWKMFTTTARYHEVLEGEAMVGGTWRPIDLPALFPTHWESGYRYERGSFADSRTRMRTLAASTCLRHPEHPEAVRFLDVRWKAVPGASEQTRVNAESKEIITWVCGTPWKLPNGKTI